VQACREIGTSSMVVMSSETGTCITAE
jgi:hypothetical protein